MSDSPEIDKEQLYGEFLRPSRWKDNLERKAAHKALDIPEDDQTEIKVDKSVKGIGAKGLVAVALAMGVPGVGVAYMGLQALKAMKPATEVVEKLIPGENKTIHKTTNEKFRLGDHVIE